MPLYVNVPLDITTLIVVFSSFAFHAPALNVSMYLPPLRSIAGVVAEPGLSPVPNLAHCLASFPFTTFHSDLSYFRVLDVEILLHIPSLPPVPSFRSNDS